MKKKTYIKGFFTVVAVLALTRIIWPEVATQRSEERGERSENSKSQDSAQFSNLTPHSSLHTPHSSLHTPHSSLHTPHSKHPIYSVPAFKTTFPDNNDVQMEAAKRNGVPPVKNREEAENRMKELVYVGANPYFHVDKLNNSIPYLVPKASALLQDIGRSFFDSLQIKGIPLHKIIVTSVLRTKDDVTKLRNRNGNATENSCHLYGTTFDLCYNRYITIEDPEGPKRRVVRNDTLKWVLSEVLRDFREQNRCYIKYEVKQGCFHMTVN
ncbi:MAG: DUF5715 family protein [Prevotella sp.]